MTRAMRNKEPISCLMIDIDHFKSINDRFGHEAGDRVIKSVATIIQRAVHDTGTAFRYGGEEFWRFSPVRTKRQRMSAQRRFTTACRPSPPLRADRNWSG